MRKKVLWDIFSQSISGLKKICKNTCLLLQSLMLLCCYETPLPINSVHYFQFLIVWTKPGQLIFNWNKELIFYTKDPAESLYMFKCVNSFWQFRVCVVLEGFSSLANHKGSSDTVLWVKYMRPTYTLWTCTA